MDRESGRPSTNYAQFESRAAYLSDPGRSALEMCESYFGLSAEMIEALVGRYTRGARKGLLRGRLNWTRCVHGGWVTGRGLVRRGLTEITLSVVTGYDPRHGLCLTTPIARWTRYEGMSYV